MKTLEKIPGSYSICKLRYLTRVDLTLLLAEPFYALSKSPEETTLLCATKLIDAFSSTMERHEDGFKAMRFAGQLGFDMKGVIAGVSTVLADADVAIYVQSTFDTDYVLLREADVAKAEVALIAAGYEIATLSQSSADAA